MFKKSLLIMLLMALFAPWAAMGQETLTIYENETGTNTYVPYCVNYNDGYQATEFIIPASELTTIVNAEISALQFYVDVATYSLNGTISIYLQETTQDEITYSNYKRYFFGPEGATKVYEGSLNIADNKLSIPFTTNYTYEGDNLVVCLHQSAKGTGYQSQNFYGKTNTPKAGAVYKYSTSTFTYNSELTGSAAYFTPKTTITYETTGGTCPKPKTLAFSDIEAQSATFSWVAGSGYTGTYDVAISQTEATEPQVSEIVATDHNTNTYGFTGLTPQTTYWAYVRAHCGSDWVKKDFTTDYMCSAPTGLTVDNETSSTADLSWTAGGEETSWNLRYKKTTDAEWTTINDVTLTSGVYTLEGLASHSTYIFQVQANCPGTGNYTSDWSDSSDEFTTACGVVSITPNSYEYGFEDASELDCWTMNNTHTSTGITSGNVHVGSYKFQFYNNYNGTVSMPQYLISPQLNTTNKGVRVELYYRAYYSSGTSYEQKFKVGYSTTNTDVASFTWDNDETSTTSTSYALFQKDYAVSGIKYIAIQYTSGVYSLFIDDITFSEAPSCFQPTNLEASAVTSSTATLSWTEGSTSQDHWDIYYSTSATAPTASTTPSVSNTDTNPYTIENLSESTAYYAWVRGNCGSGDVSQWSEVVSFTTPCNAFPIPYEYGFEDDTDMDCWTVRNPSPNTTITSSGHDSSHSFYFYYGSSYATQYLITPELSGTSTGLNVAFYYKRTYSTATLQVGYSTTTNETSAFDGNWTSLEESISTSYQLYETVFPANTKYVAFKYNSTGWDYINIDDISLSVPNSCAKPTGLTAVANTLGSNGITLTWTAGGEESEWTLQYATNNTFTEGLVTIDDINTNSIALTSLTANTQYYARVKANCSATSASDWCNDIYSFRTDCGTIAIAYSYGFEEEAEMNCWNMENCYSSTGRLSGNGYNSSSYSFRFVNYSDYNAQRLISPEISNATTGVHVEFYYKKVYDYTEQFKVGYSTNGTDFTFGEEITDATTTYQKYDNNFPAGTKYIAIQYATASYYLYIDNISLTTPPTCWKPTGLQVVANSVSAHAATLSWTAGNEETNWILQYSTDPNFSGTPGEIEVATTPTKEITDLAGETAYYVRVKADCGNNDESDWSSVVNFTTDVACVAPTSPGASARTAHTANVYWTANEGQSEWEIAYSNTWGFNPDAEGVTHVTGITGDHSSQSPYIMSIPGSGTYYLKVRSNCGGIDGNSAWSSQTSFYSSYSGAVAPSSFAASDITTSSAVLTWTGAATNDYHESYEICYSTSNSVPTDLVENTNYFTGIDETTYTLGNLTDGTQYYVWVRDNCGTDGYSSWTSTNFTTLELCSTPTNLHVTAYTTTTATLEWTAETGQSAWVIYYSTSNQAPAPDQATGIVAVTTNPYTLTGLTAETTYYAWVRGDCGSGVVSGWSQVCEFTPSAAAVLDLYTEGTSTNSFAMSRIPFYANNVDSNAGIESQFIIPATDMGNAIKGGAIQKLTFYSNYGSDASFGNATFDVKISEVDNSYFTSTSLINISSDAVYSGSLSYSNGKLTINLTTPYVYQGGNMIVDIRLTTKGTPANISWIGNSTTNYQSLYKPYSGNNTRYQFVPKTTITYLPAVAFTTAGNWNVADNWSTGVIPGTTDNVIINAACTIPATYTAEINNITIGTGSLTIAEGGQLKHNNTVQATLQKHIDRYTGEKDNYYLIATPFDIDPSTITGMLENEFDLYYFEGYNAGEEWRNYEADEFDVLNAGQGYLYANSEDLDLEISGEIGPSTDNDFEYGGLYDPAQTAPFIGWSIAGNPFACNAYPVLKDGTAASFYKINGTEFAVSNESFMRPLEGILIQETDVQTSYYFNRTAPAKAPSQLNIGLAQMVTSRDAHPATDNAIVRFDNGNTLQKFSFRQGSSKVYIPQDGKDYAVVNAGNMGELPVNFKAERNGTYTLSFTAEEVDFGYLHLVDNMTGNDVDLLDNPSYTFDARYTDYESRFRLVFATGNAANSDQFAFISNGEIIVNGTGTIQVIDALGRVIVTRRDGACTVSTDGMTPGVYVIRLVNGSDVKTQKIVVK